MNQLLSKLVLKSKRSPIFIRLFNWEYWSFGVIYTPIYFYWFYLCVKARSLFFFSAANPTIKNGGFLMECKSEVYQLIPQHFYPKTVLVKQGLNSTQMAAEIKQAGFSFPIIAKPDIGGRGRGVKKLYNMEDTTSYILQCNFPMLVQEFVPYEFEAGIFYYRYPWKANGNISGIVAKIFLKVTGNGISTIEELLQQNPRYILQLNQLRKTAEINLQMVPGNEEEIIICPYGNHARGAKFDDAFKEINPILESTIDNICKQIPGFYYGRLDIKFSSWEDLNVGKNFSIIELNGAGSEPTHMYDSKHSIFFAWKEIIRHWKILWRISTWNKNEKNIPFLNFKEGLNMFSENRRIEKKLNEMF